MTDPVFFRPTRPLSLAEIAALVRGKVATGDPSVSIDRVSPLDQAGPRDLTFFDNPRYLVQFKATTAAACITAERHAASAPAGTAVITSDQPYRAVALVMQALFPQAFRLEGPYGQTGISPAAHVHPSAKLEADVTVEPGAVIGADAEIGRGTVISAGAVIGQGVRFGRDGYVGANASVTFALVGNRVTIHAGARIGQDGFGFAMGAGGHLKVPQIGRVVIQDDVEIGANTMIDRGSNRDTIIGEGTKIDNGVQIGHNVVVGRHCILVSQVGIAGSAVLGDYVAIGGQAGLNGHIKVGNGAQISGGSLVKDDVPAGERWLGIPAMPIRDWTREQSAIKKLVKTAANTSATGEHGS